MATIAVKREDLESYEKVLSDVDFAIAFREQAKEQRKLVDAIKGLLNSYIKAKKYPQKSIDAQNRSFAKKQAEDIVSIVKENFTSAYDNLEAYIDKALKEIESSVKPSQDSLSRKDIQSLKTSIKPIFDSIALEIKNVKQAKKDNKKPRPDSKTAESSELENARVTLRNTVTGKAIKNFVKRNIFIPNLDLGLVNKFISKNVFTNIEKALTSRNFVFHAYGVREKQIKNIYGIRIWNPSISDIEYPFIQYEKNLTKGIIDVAKNSVVFLFKKAANFANSFFPIFATAQIIKFGFKAAFGIFRIATKILRGGIKVLQSAFSFVSSIVKNTVSTIKKVSGFTIKLLKASIDKITGSKFLKITLKGMLAFFKTYAGAYVLGFILGRIASRVGSIIKLALAAKDIVLEKINAAKIWWDANVQTPYIDPLLAWLDRHFKETANNIAFYSDLIVKEFTEESDENEGILSKTLKILKLFVPLNNDGTYLVSLKKISQNVTDLRYWVENNLTKEKLKGFSLNAGFTLTGGLLGSLLGGAVGTLGAAIPIIGPFLPVIGSLLGGYFGEEFGDLLYRLIFNSVKKIEAVKSEESPLRKYIRENLGEYSQSYGNTVFGSAYSEHIDYLEKIGKDVRNALDGVSIDTIETVKDYSIRFGGITSRNRDRLSQLSEIKTLTYDKFFKEISNTLEEMGTILNSKFLYERDGKIKNTPLGMMSYKDIINFGTKENWGMTEISLNGRKTLFNSVYALKEKGLNPYWAKIARDVSILNALRLLSLNQISADEFLELVNDNVLNNEDFFHNKYIKDIFIDLGNGQKVTFSTLSKRLFVSTPSFMKDLNSFYESRNSIGVKYFRNEKIERVLKNGNSSWIEDEEDIAGYFPTKSLGLFKGKTADASWKNILLSSGMKMDLSGFQNLTEIYNGEISKDRSFEQFDLPTVAARIYQTLGQGAEKKFNALEDKESFVRKMLNDLESEEDVQYLGFDLSAATSRMSAAVDSLNSGISPDDLQNALETALQASGTEEPGPTLEQYSQLVVFANENIRKAIPEIIKKLRERGVDERAIVAVFGKHANATDVQDNVVSPKPVD